ncbi:MAG: hypothetical protein ACJAZW_001763 [Maritalea sp.]|jgi:hypothetical protein
MKLVALFNSDPNGAAKTAKPISKPQEVRLKNIQNFLQVGGG